MSLPVSNDPARAGVLHQIRGETPDDARTALLEIARTAAERGDRFVVVSTAEPAELSALAEGIGFDLGAAAQRGAFRLLRPSPALLRDGASDNARAHAFADLLARARSERPAVFVLDDAAALDRFDDASAFAAALDDLYSGLADDGIAFALTEIEAEAEPPSSNAAPPASGDGVLAPEPDIAYPPLHPSPLPPADLFALSAPTQGLGHAHFVGTDLRMRGDALPDIVPAAEEGPVAAPGARLSIATGAAALLDTVAFDVPAANDDDDPLLPPSEPAPRRAFEEAFEAARAAFERAGTPFAAVAVRAGEAACAALPFAEVIDAVASVFGPEAALVAERDRAAWLVSGTADVAPYFADVREALRTTRPDADVGLRGLAVAVAPNGEPFADAQAFLSHVLG